MDDIIAKDKAERRYIGGQDAATIALEAAGKTPPFGRSAFDVWSRLMCIAPEQKDTDRFELGRLMEEPIAQRFANRTKMRLYPVEMIVHPGYDWVGGHIDRGAYDHCNLVRDEGSDADVECKTVGWYDGRDEEWSDPNSGEAQRVPMAYMIQAVWYAGIPRPGILQQDDPVYRETLPAFSRRIYIAAQFDFRPLRVYGWEPNDTIKTIWARTFEACQEFWERYVQTGDPPPAPKDTAGEKRWLNVKFPNAGEEMLTADYKALELAKAYKEAQARESAAKAEKEKLGNELGRLIGSAYGIEGTIEGKRVRVSWPTIRKEPFMMAPAPYRQLYVNVKEEK
jgi:predicted phage-related endonuclease